MIQIPWWHTEISELESNHVLTAFKNKQFSQGPVTEDLEEKIGSYLNVPYVIMSSNGTSALMMALIAAGVKPGDEVIVPSLTWIATAQAAAILGAKIVCVDSLRDSPLLDPAEVKKKITSRTKAIIPVYLNGKSCRLNELRSMIRNRRIALIEDACKAFASRNQDGFLGTLGDLGCFSLGMISMVSCGYGGAVATRNKKIYSRLKLIQNHGILRHRKEKFLTIGLNFKFSDILAAIGMAQMTRIDDKLVHVKKIYRCYQDHLLPDKDLQLIPVDVESGAVPLCVEVRSKRREEIMAYLKEQGIDSIPFHLPIHQAKYLGSPGRYPNASRFAREGFVLPCGPTQPLENVVRCIEVIKEWSQTKGRKSQPQNC